HRAHPSSEPQAPARGRRGLRGATAPARRDAGGGAGRDRAGDRSAAAHAPAPPAQRSRRIGPAAARGNPGRRRLAGRQPAHAMNAAATPVDFYFEFSSPYGYIASRLADDLEERIGRRLRWRPILLGPIFKITGQAPLTQLPMKGPYAQKDFSRTARLHGIAYRH